MHLANLLSTREHTHTVEHCEAVPDWGRGCALLRQLEGSASSARQAHSRDGPTTATRRGARDSTRCWATRFCFDSEALSGIWISRSVLISWSSFENSGLLLAVVSTVKVHLVHHFLSGEVLNSSNFKMTVSFGIRQWIEVWAFQAQQGQCKVLPAHFWGAWLEVFQLPVSSRLGMLSNKGTRVSIRIKWFLQQFM